MASVPLIDLQAQYATLRAEIERALHEVLETQTFVLGPVVERFERELAGRVGVAHAIGCASGTDALVLSLAALGVGPGDEVLTTPFSFVSTASCAQLVGARPAFADIDPQTFNLDPERAAAAITSRTRALLPVHLFGQCAAMDRLGALAADHGIPIVEDAAQAIGSAYRTAAGGRWVQAGALGRLGCFSFFPTKNLGGFGDGGAVVTSDGSLASRLRSLRVHGRRDAYDSQDVGWNSRLDAIQAAVLSVKLRHLAGWSEARAAHAELYDRLLADSGLVEQGAVSLPGRDPDCRHTFNQYTLRVRTRDALCAHLREREIGHAVYYPIPLHLQRCFAELGYRAGDFPHAEQACREVVSLPVHPELTPAQQEQVVGSIVDFYRDAG